MIQKVTIVAANLTCKEHVLEDYVLWHALTMKWKSKLSAHHFSNWVVYAIITYSAPLSIVADLYPAIIFPDSIFQPHISVNADTLMHNDMPHASIYKRAF